MPSSIDTRLAAMFDGPSPTARRIDGIRDARSGKPPSSGDRDHLSGHDAGKAYGGKRGDGPRHPGADRPTGRR